MLKYFYYRLSWLFTGFLTGFLFLEPAIGQKFSDEMVLLPMGSEWRYLDDGSDQGTAWMAPEFDDAGWKSGLGEFGYGDGTHKTLIDFGNSSSQKFITTYFRSSFVVTMEDIDRAEALRIDMVADDGAAVYINGVEVIRVNLADSAKFQTTAARTINNDDEIPIPSFLIGLEHVKFGTNTIAVELHQASPSSSDLAFDMNVSLSRRLYGLPRRLGHYVSNAEVHQARTRQGTAIVVGRMALYPNTISGRNTGDFSTLPAGRTILATDDLNADGLDEILSLRQATTHSSAVLTLVTAEREGIHSERRIIATGSGLTEQLQGTLADIDGDGLKDVIIIRNKSDEDEGSDEATWRKNLGNLQLDVEKSLIDLEQLNPGRVVAGDFTKDGRSDLVIIQERGGGRLHTQDNDGTFFPARREPIPTVQHHFFRVAELDGDGKADLVYLHGHALAGLTSVPEDLITVRGTQLNLAVHDFDGDGDNDILMNDGESIHWNLNNGFGEFGLKRLVAQTGPCEYAAVADMNGDGLADIVANTAENGLLFIPAISRQSPIVTQFEVNTPVLEEPGSVELMWDVLGAETVMIEPGPGLVEGSGSITVPVNQTSTFSISATFGDTTVTNSLNITVQAFTRTIPGGRIRYASGGSIAAADIDGDQKDDLLHQFDSTFAVFQQGADGIQKVTEHNFRVRNNEIMTARDIDADGLPDLVFLGAGNDAVFFQLAPFEFSPGVEIPTYGSPSYLFDFDGDEDLDLITFNVHPDQQPGIQEFRLGAFTAPPSIIQVPASIRDSLVWIDTNGDDSSDLVAVTDRGLIVFGTEDGVLSGAETLLFYSEYQGHVLAEDFDGDGQTDVLFYSEEWKGVIGFPVKNGVISKHGSLLGQFLDKNTHGMWTDDLNGDGILDFIEIGNLQWLRGTAGGNYSAEAKLPQQYRSLRNSQTPYQDVYFDFDSDGDLDYLSYNAEFNQQTNWVVNEAAREPTVTPPVQTFSVQNFAVSADGTVSVEWISEKDELYKVESSFDLTDWKEAPPNASPIVGRSGTTTTTLSNQPVEDSYYIRMIRVSR